MTRFFLVYPDPPKRLPHRWVLSWVSPVLPRTQPSGYFLAFEPLGILRVIVPSTPVGSPFSSKAPYLISPLGIDSLVAASSAASAASTALPVLVFSPRGTAPLPTPTSPPSSSSSCMPLGSAKFTGSRCV